MVAAHYVAGSGVNIDVDLVSIYLTRKGKRIIILSMYRNQKNHAQNR
jgi:hypothetical protein